LSIFVIVGANIQLFFNNTTINSHKITILMRKIYTHFVDTYQLFDGKFVFSCIKTTLCAKTVVLLQSK